MELNTVTRYVIESKAPNSDARVAAAKTDTEATQAMIWWSKSIELKLGRSQGRGDAIMTMRINPWPSEMAV